MPPNSRAGCALETRREARVRERARAEAEQLRHELDRARLRRRWATGVAAVFAVASIVTAVLWLQVRAARDSAERERAVARAVNEFLVEDLIAAADPLTSGRSDISVADILDRGARTAGARFAAAPLQEAAVRLALGRSYIGIGDYAAALAQFARTAALTEPIGETARNLLERAELETLITYNVLDRNDELKTLAVKLIDSPDPVIRLRTQQLLARMQLLDGDLEGSIAAYADLLPRFQTQLGENTAETASLHEYYGLALRDAGRFDEAVAQLERAVAIRTSLYGPDDVRTLDAQQSIGGTWYLAGRWQEAEAIQSRNVANAIEVLPADHWQLAVLRYNWANQLGHLGERERALDLFDQSIAALTEQIGADHPATQRAIGYAD